MTTPTQVSLFHTGSSGPSRPTRPPVPSRSTPPPESPPSQEALLQEIISDWWATLDPRNWKGDGPSDAEVLARYAVTGTEADDWPIVSGSRMYFRVWSDLKAAGTPPDAVIEAVHDAIRLHGQDVLRTAQDIVPWHLERLVITGTWHPQAREDTLGILGRLSRFLGRPVPTLPQLATAFLPSLRLQIEANVLETQARQLRIKAHPDNQPSKKRHAAREAESAQRHLDDLRQALDRVKALLNDPESLPPLPSPELSPPD